MESAESKVKVLAETDQRIVGMCEYKGSIIVATERGAYRLEGDVFVPIKFVDENGNV